MYSRRFFRFAVAGAACAAGAGFAAPAFASVTYDPDTKVGFVDRSDVRNAFGWTGRTLASQASGLVFDHDFWTDDTYSVSCGGPAFPVVHHRDYGWFELADEVARDARGGAATGYGGKLIGFRLTGARLGISGTSVPPMAGQPCPDDPQQPSGSTIDDARLVSTTTGWALSVKSGDVSRELLRKQTSDGGAATVRTAAAPAAG